MKFILLLILFLSISIASFSQTFYVNTALGNDANNGTSLATAWATIQQSMDNAIPGSTVFILEGTYIEQLQLNVSGNLGSNIVFRPYQNDLVIIDGNNQNVNLLYIENQKYFEIHNLKFSNTLGNGSSGVTVTGTSSNFVFKGNRITGVKWTSLAATIPGFNDNVTPFVVYGNTTTPITNVKIDSNFIYGNINGFSENLTLDGNILNFEITRNNVHDNTNIGILCAGNYLACPDPLQDFARNGLVSQNVCYRNVSNYATSGGIYMDGARDIIVERNESYENGYGIEIGAEENGTTQNITVRNNIIYNNKEAGISLGGYTSATTGQVLNAKIVNNTLFQNDYSNSGQGEILISKASNCVFQNNVIYASQTSRFLSRDNISPQANNAFKSNNWFSNPSTPNAFLVNWGGTAISDFASFISATNGTNELFQNPDFTELNLTSLNLKPLAGSPIINSGDMNNVAQSGLFDFTGLNRVQQAIIDRGAYEFEGFSSIFENSQTFETATFMIFPNPCTSNEILSISSSIILTRAEFSLVDLKGKIIQKGIIDNSQIKLEKLNSGIYFLNILGHTQKVQVF